MKILGFEVGFGAKKVAEPEPVNELVSQLERIPRELREMLMKKGRTDRILTRVQVRLLAKSCGFILRHYSFFEGVMPANKIFALPELSSKMKVYRLVGCANMLLNEFRDETGVVTSVKMEDLKRNHGNVSNLTFDEEPALFIMAPAQLFRPTPTTLIGLDPIMLEQISENSFQVVTFWDVPEDVAVHLARFDQN